MSSINNSTYIYAYCSGAGAPTTTGAAVGARTTTAQRSERGRPFEFIGSFASHAVSGRDADEFLDREGFGAP